MAGDAVGHLYVSLFFMTTCFSECVSLIFAHLDRAAFKTFIREPHDCSRFSLQPSAPPDGKETVLFRTLKQYTSGLERSTRLGEVCDPIAIPIPSKIVTDCCATLKYVDKYSVALS